MLKQPIKSIIVILMICSASFNNACQRDNPYFYTYELAVPWVVGAAKVGALYLFGKFFYGGYQHKINELEQRQKTDHKIVAMLAASALGDPEKEKIVRDLIHKKEREQFIDGASLADKDSLNQILVSR